VSAPDRPRHRVDNRSPAGARPSPMRSNGSRPGRSILFTKLKIGMCAALLQNREQFLSFFPFFSFVCRFGRLFAQSSSITAPSYRVQAVRYVSSAEVGVAGACRAGSSRAPWYGKRPSTLVVIEMPRSFFFPSPSSRRAADASARFGLSPHRRAGSAPSVEQQLLRQRRLGPASGCEMMANVRAPAIFSVVRVGRHGHGKGQG